MQLSSRRGAILVLVGLVLVAQLGALGLAGTLADEAISGETNIATDETETPDTASQVDTVLTGMAALLATALIAVVAIRTAFSARALVRGVVLLGATAYTILPLAAVVGVGLTVTGAGSQAGWALTIAGAFALSAWAFLRPRPLNLNALGVLLAMAAGPLVAVQVGVLGAVLLLVVLAVYDALSVYVTGHMLDLASAGLDADLPILLDVPHEDGRAMLGLGDVVVPGVLIAAGAIRFGPAVGAGALAGTMAGLVAVQALASRGSVHAGLPPLNGGALAGYLAAAVWTGVAVGEALGLRGLDASVVARPVVGVLVVAILAAGLTLALYSRGRESAEVVQ